MYVCACAKKIMPLRFGALRLPETRLQQCRGRVLRSFRGFASDSQFFSLELELGVGSWHLAG